MIYNLNDLYYINHSIDLWLNDCEPEYIAEDENAKIPEERCMSDD